jgi:methyl coenzyme M reductase subunit D
VADQKNSEAYEFIEEISEKRLDLSYQIFIGRVIRP